MKPAARHQVHKLSLDVQLRAGTGDSHERAQAMQQRVSLYCREQLELALQPCFDEAAGDERVYRIRRIELDLGRIVPARLEADLGERLRDALRTHLRRLGLPRPALAPAASGWQESEPEHWQALLNWLARGVARAEQSPGELFERAVLHAPARLAATLRSATRHAELSERLAAALPEPIIEQVVGVLVPSDAVYVVGYVRQMRRVERLDAPVRAEGQGLRVALWAFILNYLLDSRGSEFNRRAFVISTLRQMAARYRLTFDDLLTQLTRSIEQFMTREGRPGSLLSMLHALRQQRGEIEAEPVPAPMPASTAAVDPNVTVLEPIERRLQSLIALLQGRADRYGGLALGELDVCLAELAGRQPAVLRAALRSVLRSEDARRRLLRGLSAHGRRRLWHWLAPEHARRIGRLLGSLKRALQDGGDSQLDMRLAETALDHWTTATTSFEPIAFVRGVLSRYGETLSTVARAQSYQLDEGRFLIEGLRSPSEGNEPTHERQGTNSVVERLRHWLDYGLWTGGAARDDTLDKWLASLPDDVIVQTVRAVGPVAAVRIAREVALASRERLLRLLAGEYLEALFDLRVRVQVAAQAWRASEHEWLERADRVLLASLLESTVNPAQWIGPLTEVLALHTLRDYDEVLAALGQTVAEPAPDRAAVADSHRQFVHWLERGYFAEPLHASMRAELRRAVERGAFAYAVDARSPDSPSHSRLFNVIRASSSRLLSWRGARRAINLVRPAWLPQAASSDQAQLAQLIALFSTGSAPWWGSDLPHPQRSFERLLAQQPEQLVEALRKVGVYPGALSRMVRWVPVATRHRLLLALSPGTGGLVLSWLNAGSALAQSVALTGGQRRRAAGVHWEVALGLLLRPHGEVASTAVFLDEASRQVAYKLRLPPECYRELVLAVAIKGAEREARYAVLAELLGGEPVVDRASGHVPEPVGAAPARYRLVHRSPDAVQSDPRDEALLARVDNMLRFGHALAQTTLSELASLSAGLATWPAARRRAWRRFFERSFAEPLQRQRLASLLPPALLLRLLPLWLTKPQIATIALLLVRLRQLTILPSHWRRHTQAVAWDVLFEQLYRQRGVHQSLPLFAVTVAKRLAEHHKVAPLALLDAWERGLAGSETEARRALQPARRIAVVESFPKPPSKPVPYVDPHREALPEAEPLYVENAGLVLLWPFLARYFELLGLVEEGAFVDEAARSRAVYLLQYLACGNHDAPEHALTLNKFLCGMPFARAPEFVDPPTEEEKRIGRDLLYAVTQRWEKLKNTSVEGLQETFLMREGRLLCEAERATLTVQKKTVDVLLDSLHWGLSTIRLPWQPQVLFVKWR